MDLNIFYTALATAAATLLGLLFIAIQPNIERLSAHPQYQWKALAVSTFHIYTSVFVLAMFSFIPAYRVQITMVTAVLGIWRQLRTWSPVWRQTLQAPFERWRETFWLLLGPVLTYLALLYSAIQLQHGRGNVGIETNIATEFVIMMVIVLRNTWRLLVEIPTEQQWKA